MHLQHKFYQIYQYFVTPHFWEGCILKQFVITRRRNYNFTEYWKHFMVHFNDVHVSGYNSAGSERIWMKFGALRVYCLQLALTDFGRDLRRSESGKAIWNCFCQVNNARLYQFPVSQISGNLHTRCGSMSLWILSENNFWKFARKGPFFQKGQRLPKNRHRLPTSGRDICETNTNRGKSRLVGTPTECWLSICNVGINSKPFPWPAGCVQGTTFLEIAGSSV